MDHSDVVLFLVTVATFVWSDWGKLRALFRLLGLLPHRYDICTLHFNAYSISVVDVQDWNMHMCVIAAVQILTILKLQEDFQWAVD